MYVMRRRHRFDEDEEAAYFEKLPEPSVFDSSATFAGASPGATAPRMSTGPSAYLDGMAHSGTADSMNDPQVYPMDYPPGTALARAATQKGQYQYTGQYGGYADDAYPTHPPALGAHPFADPMNANQPGRAPPVNFHGAEHATNTFEPDAYTGVAQ